MTANCKRSHNFVASKQKLFKKFKSVIECKQTDAKSVWDMQTVWKDLTNVFNSQATHVPQNDDQLKTMWKNMKARIKKSSALSADENDAELVVILVTS